MKSSRRLEKARSETVRGSCMKPPERFPPDDPREWLNHAGTYPNARQR